MSVRFNNVEFRNFLATGEASISIPLDAAASTLIVGKNGSGKSQFLDAISFALFNKAFRRINKNQLVNSITGKNCVCEVDFARGNRTYRVRRGIKPNFLEIYQDGELLKKLDDPEAYIERMLGMNQKSFFQVVVLGAALYTPFMQLKVPERRVVVEDLLDLQVFTTMAAILKLRIGELQELTSALTMQLAAARYRVEAEERHLRLLQENTEEMIKDKQDNIVLEEAKIIVLEKKNIDLKEALLKSQNLIQDDHEVVQNIRKYDALEVQIRGRTHSLNDELRFYSDHSECPTCKQSIHEEFRKSILAEKQREHAELTAGLIQLKRKTERLRNRQTEIDDVKQQMLIITNEWTQNKHMMFTWESMITNLKAEIAKLEYKTTAETGMLEPYKAEVAKLEAESDKLANQRAVMDAAAELLKDQGVRAQVIKKYLPVLNKLINHYLAQMEFMCHLELDEGFNETIKSRFRDDFSYESFSEGEKMRIDLSVLFAWREITKMRNSSSANLLVFDEVLDSSLDQDGADEFLKIVNSLTDGQNVLVISHRGDMLVDKFKDVIRFDKNRGFSVASAA